MSRYALGLDFGTESVRALAVDCDRGAEAANIVVPYEHGVISRSLPGSKIALPPDFALQHAGDYIPSMVKAIQGVRKEVSVSEIIGIGVDFTACTILPIRKDGVPLMLLPEFRKNPHAWVKLWKHHAAQPEANRVNEVAHARNEPFLKYYSGIISSEWMLPKCLEIGVKSPEVYRAADLIIDAGDWIVHQITGRFTRNACAAGYKGLWTSEFGFPSERFLAALDPVIRDVRTKWLQNIIAPGRRAGVISKEFARRSGLKAGTPVSAATIDAHSGVPGMGVSGEGPVSIIMGTSSCHMVLSKALRLFNGYAGVTKDGIIPGFYGYESGQSAVGDIFAWFAREFLQIQSRDPFALLSKKARQLRPGQTGLLVLDWMNGNRSVLMNANLSGMILGLTLASQPEEVYRALIEGTAFGTRIIVDSYRRHSVSAKELVVCGGLVKDPLIMQIYADIVGLPVRVAASTQAVALGAAIFGAVAAGREAGGFLTVDEAIDRMTRPPVGTFKPDRAAAAVYNKLFELYRRCHDYFGREQAELMIELKSLRNRALGGGTWQK
jgi:L-ribulokinase